MYTKMNHKRDFENHLIVPALEAAVLLYALEMHRKPIDQLWSQFEAERLKASALIGEKGDILIFGHGKYKGKSGQIAEVFNSTAKAIGYMSVLMPGGVKAFRHHFEFPHPDLAQVPDPFKDVMKAFSRRIKAALQKVEE